MVQILPEVPSFGALLGRNLGQGLSRGAEFASQMGLEKVKTNQRQKTLKDILGDHQAPGQDRSKEFIEALPEIEQAIGRELSPQDVDQLWGKFSQMQQPQQRQQDPFRTAEQLALAGEHELAKVYTELGKVESKERLARHKEAEPKLLELEDRLRTHEMQSMRFDRLGELFRPELEDKFPSSTLVGLFTKDGELRPTAAALLSPEAQEAVKLVADEISGAKDTFGARVTNFDLQAYMKKLPTLLNTAEGRRRVLRDLKLINELNSMHDEGILNIMEEYGGAGHISVSKAERIFKKQFAPRIKAIRDEFVNPEKNAFSNLPSARTYEGRKIRDEETGQVFVSDGTEWIPQ